ncbi:hypothetical protein GCM10009104_08720 [Marinobacterium maritimum]|uniref:Carbon storage regulator n=1 Tax=Marinobacterium maritimum TaxID=500162 RepID=A0ABN1I3K2_9GAMM
MTRRTRLTLTRKKAQAIIIDHDIRVIVRNAQGGKAKITIEAPEDVDIIREELDGILDVEIPSQS